MSDDETETAEAAALADDAEDIADLADGHRRYAAHAKGFDRENLLAQARDYDRMARLMKGAAATVDPDQRARLLIAVDEMAPRVKARARQLVFTAEVQRDIAGGV